MNDASWNATMFVTAVGAPPGVAGLERQLALERPQAANAELGHVERLSQLLGIERAMARTSVSRRSIFGVSQ